QPPFDISRASNIPITPPPTIRTRLMNPPAFDLFSATGHYNGRAQGRGRTLTIFLIEDSWMNQKTFMGGHTLLELIIVVAILSILLSMAAPAFSTWTDKSQRSIIIHDLLGFFSLARQ